MRILVTGATGYVGSRLIPQLVIDGHEVVAAMRDPDRLATFAWGDDVVATSFDLTDPASLTKATSEVDVVVYLVHSMADGDFVRKDLDAAEALVAAASANGVCRIVYLSGLVPPTEDLSDHIRSRLQVEQTFLDSEIPALVLRAAVIIGSGSTSFELVRRLSERMPITPRPTWMTRTVQPIAIHDVVHLLSSAVTSPIENEHYDVGGDEVVSYPQLLAAYARVAGLRRPQVPVPLLPHWVVGAVAARITRIPHGTVQAIVESLDHDMVCGDDRVRADIADAGHQFLSLDEALARSLSVRNDGTDETGDVQSSANSDPDWAGGDIAVIDGHAVHRPSTWRRRLGMGVRR